MFRLRFLFYIKEVHVNGMAHVFTKILFYLEGVHVNGMAWCLD